MIRYLVYDEPDVDIVAVRYPDAEYALFRRDGEQLTNWTRWGRPAIATNSEVEAASHAGIWSGGRFRQWFECQISFRAPMEITVQSPRVTY